LGGGGGGGFTEKGSVENELFRGMREQEKGKIMGKIRMRDTVGAFIHDIEGANQWLPEGHDLKGGGPSKPF